VFWASSRTKQLARFCRRLATIACWLGATKGVVVPTTSFIYFGAVVRAVTTGCMGGPVLAGGFAGALGGV